MATRFKTVLLSFLLMTIPFSGSLHAESGVDRLSIGVYYFPAWTPAKTGTGSSGDWKRIAPYPERKPLLGWYDDSDVNVVNTQLGWMKEYGIDFVIFDWYWQNRKTKLEEALNAYLKATNRKNVSYALLWANHDGAPVDLEDWDSLVDNWITRFKNPEYLKVDGKPVVIVFSGEGLTNRIKEIYKHDDGSALSRAELFEKTAGLLDMARKRAKDNGLQGIYFVAHVEATNYWVNEFSKKIRFDAITSYNFHRGREIDEKLDSKNVDPANSRSFAELDAGYQKQWKSILSYTDATRPYFVPMISGWDKRPWGGSTRAKKDANGNTLMDENGKTIEEPDPEHDNSTSTPQEFRRHLYAGYKTITQNLEKTKGIGVICCWNEFGEGSIIEPTKRYGFQYIQGVKGIFGSRKTVK